jgi:hypothetical protein
MADLSKKPSSNAVANTVAFALTFTLAVALATLVVIPKGSAVAFAIAFAVVAVAHAFLLSSRKDLLLPLPSSLPLGLAQGFSPATNRRPIIGGFSPGPSLPAPQRQP